MSNEFFSGETLGGLRQAAKAALQEYGISGARFSFLKDCKQPAFRVRQTGDGLPKGKACYKSGTFLLRMYAPGVRRPALIRSELAWLRAIIDDTRLIVPEPVDNRRGDTVTRVSLGDGPTFHCALTRWVEGSLYLRKHGPGPAALRQVGRVMAQLHAHSQSFMRPKGFCCHRWEAEKLFGAKSPYYPNADKKLLCREDRRLFAKVERAARWRSLGPAQTSLVWFTAT